MPLPPRLTVSNSTLLVVDLQDRLLPAIEQAEQCIQASRRMIEAGRVFGLPILATEQYPAGLGHTCSAIREVLADTSVIEKIRFSGCVEPVVQKLKELARPLVVVVGIEAHVCVQQTVLDLLSLGYTPFLCADAVGSRRSLDRDIAIERMRQAGAIITTTESAIFEMTGQAGTEQFKQILRIVK